jgi:hypothetical protein
MVSNERIEGAINIFFVKDANNGAIATGALFGDPFPSVTISNTTVSNGVTWSTFNSGTLAHELGHCLRLLHTNEFAGGIEEIPRTGPLANCTTAGDGLCDTPADHGLGISTTNVDETSCAYIGNQTRNGFSYAPDTRNVMSYTLPHCMLHFSPEQGARMRAAIQNSTELDEFVIPRDKTFNGMFQTYGDHFYSVEGIINTSVYHDARWGVGPFGMQLVYNYGNTIYEAGDAIILEPDFFITATSDRSVEARIGISNCLNPLIKNEGKIGKGDDSEASANEIATDKNANISNGKTEKDLFSKPLSVIPNPFTNTFNIEFELETEGETSLIIYDALGRVVETVIVNTTLSIGKHQYQIDGTRIENGLYYATLQTTNGAQTIKIIKQ